MVKIYNCLQQRLIIQVAPGKNLEIYARGTAVISETDLNSPHLGGLIARGDIMVCSGNGGNRVHTVAKNGPKAAPADAMDAGVQPVPVKESTIQPEPLTENNSQSMAVTEPQKQAKAGTEVKTHPSQTGKGASTTAGHKKVSNPKPYSNGSSGKK